MIYEDDIKSIVKIKTPSQTRLSKYYVYKVDGENTTDWCINTFMDISGDIDYSLVEDAEKGYTFIADDLVKGYQSQKNYNILYSEYTLPDYEYHMTLEEIGKNIGVNAERVRQILAKALRKLKHPSRSRNFIETSTPRERKEKVTQVDLIKPWGDFLYD